MVLFLFFALALISSYAFIGAGIKYIDQIVDHQRNSRKNSLSSWLLTFCLTLVTSLWVFLDRFSAILAFALILGLLGTRKVDNHYFIVIALVVLPACVITLVQVNLFILLASLLPLIVSAIADELLHNTALKITNRYVQWVCVHRPLLKIVVIILPFFSLLTFTHAIAFWSFDLAYDFVAYHFRAVNLVANEGLSP
ncbi:MAG: hypothetical protein ACFE89_01600 [Candidatus Hodarchaeota archaeon]